jgi:hypothetical protein
MCMIFVFNYSHATTCYSTIGEKVEIKEIEN